MANSATLAQLRTRARQRANMENSNFIRDTEMLALINASYAELYDIMVTKYEDYYITGPTSFSISSGNTYSLPSDFYKLRGVDYLQGTQYVTIYPINWNNRNRLNRAVNRRTSYQLNPSYRIVGSTLYIYPSDDALGDYQLWYIPSFTPLADDSDLIDGSIARNGWEEYVVVDVARKMLQKEESDTRELIREKERLLVHIEGAAAERDVDQPESVTDVSTFKTVDGFGSYEEF